MGIESKKCVKSVSMPGEDYDLLNKVCKFYAAASHTTGSKVAINAVLDKYYTKHQKVRSIEIKGMGAKSKNTQIMIADFVDYLNWLRISGKDVYTTDLMQLIITIIGLEQGAAHAKKRYRLSDCKDCRLINLPDKMAYLNKLSNGCGDYIFFDDYKRLLLSQIKRDKVLQFISEAWPYIYNDITTYRILFDFVQSAKWDNTDDNIIWVLTTVNNIANKLV